MFNGLSLWFGHRQIEDQNTFHQGKVSILRDYESFLFLWYCLWDGLSQVEEKEASYNILH